MIHSQTRNEISRREIRDLKNLKNGWLTMSTKSSLVQKCQGLENISIVDDYSKVSNNHVGWNKHLGRHSALKLTIV